MTSSNISETIRTNTPGTGDEILVVLAICVVLGALIFAARVLCIYCPPHKQPAAPKPGKAQLTAMGYGYLSNFLAIGVGFLIILSPWQPAVGAFFADEKIYALIAGANTIVTAILNIVFQDK